MEEIGILVALLAAGIGYLAAHQTTNKQITKLVEQMENDRRHLDVDAVGMTSHELAAIDDILIQYPKLRPCFYDGVEASELSNLTGDDRERIKAVAARLVNGYATLLLQSRRKDGTSNQADHMLLPADWARATVARRYGNSPPCCAHLMNYIEEYAYTGRHQIALMLDGLKQARNAAIERNDSKRAERLSAMIESVEASEADLYERIDKCHRLYGGVDMVVASALEATTLKSQLNSSRKPSARK